MAQLQKEAVLSVDSFKQPQILEGKEAIGILLVRLIQLEPGTIASRPNMGVGLLSNYRYCDEEKAIQLQSHIKEQIRTYLPQYQGVKVTTKLNNDGKLTIDIAIDKTIYRYEAEQKASDNRIVGLQSIK